LEKEAITMGREEDRIRKIMEDMGRGKDVGSKLIYDTHTKTVRPASKNYDPDGAIRITPSDADLF
jgi:hypothetical protein